MSSAAAPIGRRSFLALCAAATTAFALEQRESQVIISLASCLPTDMLGPECALRRNRVAHTAVLPASRLVWGLASGDALLPRVMRADALLRGFALMRRQIRIGDAVRHDDYWVVLNVTVA